MKLLQGDCLELMKDQDGVWRIVDTSDNLKGLSMMAIELRKNGKVAGVISDKKKSLGQR